MRYLVHNRYGAMYLVVADSGEEAVRNAEPLFASNFAFGRPDPRFARIGMRATPVPEPGAHSAPNPLLGVREDGPVQEVREIEVVSATSFRIRGYSVDEVVRLFGMLRGSDVAVWRAEESTG